ncbi:MAG: ribose-5-phosphate isomerase RpiA [Oceanicaulis sp.]|uniref:ribose-5-phosphate isomerase RpiA n=1 Tax=Oceanicaulis TaxID=153232 RepID=UPI0003B6B8EC|nr:MULTISPECIES: ribose-5-phosphate isomerase RpiA [Oceanicaulis]MAP48244.1 ribose-5-phosphate isomerase RpiA [Oceanicaulis sp.]HCR67033.1 ribose-5-phosphate isomerase RpiA [Oceanicaulis sp.]|tara:strand:- start:51 stop:758 length:708 start_codon:yes stop_codon:yes gene_type:complete
MSAVEDKTRAAEAALEFIEDGMTLGLGSGSTADIFVRLLGAALESGSLNNVKGVPTSENTARVAREAGVPLIEVDQADRIDITVDGADEVDGRFRLIKGGGGCLLREKIIAHASDLMVVVVDETKLVETLGAFALPVEVDPFGFTITAKKVYDALTAAGVVRPDVKLRCRGDGNDPFVTDGGHYILDCACKALADPEQVAARLNAIPGVVEHGLFINLARAVIVGEEEGARVLEL